MRVHGFNPPFSDPPFSDPTLYRPEFEHDACGVGFVTRMTGVRSRGVLDCGLRALANLSHRGAVDADGKTGDGAGILTNIPGSLWQEFAAELGHPQVDPSRLGVGVFFLPPEQTACAEARELVETATCESGIEALGWRQVPIDVDVLGAKARATLPRIEHLLVQRPGGTSEQDFERSLYIARRNIEVAVADRQIALYVPSFSGKTISYKGLMLAEALGEFYLDLQRPEYETAICLYHQRFSTNTFPTWALGQPFRMLAHNGEINTLRGNRHWFKSRAKDFADVLQPSDNDEYLTSVIDPNASDSAALDSALEVLVLNGRSIEHAMAMLIPPAWRSDLQMTSEQQGFFRYHRCFSEPWDGPAAVVCTDGTKVVACLDRNGLRPLRYKQTDDGLFSASSEAGVLKLDDARVICKGRLAPGEIICVDTDAGSFRTTAEIRTALASRRPYHRWLRQQRIELDEHVSPSAQRPEQLEQGQALWQKQVAHGYTSEEVDMLIHPMMSFGREATHSMGDDTPLAVLSYRPRLLYHYFSQLFAQVTNPPIDPIRERLVMSISADLGRERDLLQESPEHARLIHLNNPILYPHQLAALHTISADHPVVRLDITWPLSDEPNALEARIRHLQAEADAAVDRGAAILILSDRGQSATRVALPALLATAAVHQHLIRGGRRMRCSLVLDSGEPRDTHQIACLFGYGITAICPYLAFNTVCNRFQRDCELPEPNRQFKRLTDQLHALENYRHALTGGLMKIMSKIGISVLNSYQGAQIFEAVGVGQALIGECFPGTPSQLGGIGWTEIAAESLLRHRSAYEAPDPIVPYPSLDDPGYIRFRRPDHGAPNSKEDHAIPPVTVRLFHQWVEQDKIKNFHTFAKDNDPEKYEQYLSDALGKKPVALHDMFEFAPQAPPISIEEVEPIEAIRSRFTTAAMSLGALSPEAHEMLAIAMNQIGGKSNSGEGGESADRFGTIRNSKIKQIASGRFGVHAEYLNSAEEIEIKMAQGAKPGEGGQLPGYKVTELIAKLRHTQPGIPLISPPPHHDIYSIEDLAQLIYDLKQINPAARVCVKLVAVTGVGTIAAGVAKAGADIILISGHAGGTGAAAVSSIKHAGMPWEIGLAETQQVLSLNGLRSRVTLRTDGGMRNGDDIIKAALLGAEEFNFGTIVLIAMGCVYVRRCHLNTCPVGIATQDPQRREKFHGQVAHVVNYMNSVAHQAREIMASLGVRRLDDLVGRPSLLRQRQVAGHPKANTLDFRRLLQEVEPVKVASAGEVSRQRNAKTTTSILDDQIIDASRDAIANQQAVQLNFEIRNTDRNIATKLSGVIARKYGNFGLGTADEPIIRLALRGSAGQSLGAFLVQGIQLDVVGEANDYVGKGMCGGEIILRAAQRRRFEPSQSTIAGNTVLYGATGGVLFANGQVGERFAVRNSGATAVVEGCGDHGCEYMTGGTIVVLGPLGKNFAAGMSGGEAFVLRTDEHLDLHVNREMVDMFPLTSQVDALRLHELIVQHLEKTGSAMAQMLLDQWSERGHHFACLRPKISPEGALTANAAASETL